MKKIFSIYIFLIVACAYSQTGDPNGFELPNATEKPSLYRLGVLDENNILNGWIHKDSLGGTSTLQKVLETSSTANVPDSTLTISSANFHVSNDSLYYKNDAGSELILKQASKFKIYAGANVELYNGGRLNLNNGAFLDAYPNYLELNNTSSQYLRLDANGVQLQGQGHGLNLNTGSGNGYINLSSFGKSLIVDDDGFKVNGSLFGGVNPEYFQADTDSLWYDNGFGSKLLLKGGGNLNLESGGSILLTDSGYIKGGTDYNGTDDGFTIGAVGHSLSFNQGADENGHINLQSYGRGLTIGDTITFHSPLGSSMLKTNNANLRLIGATIKADDTDWFKVNSAGASIAMDGTGIAMNAASGGIRAKTDDVYIGDGNNKVELTASNSYFGQSGRYIELTNDKISAQASYNNFNIGEDSGGDTKLYMSTQDEVTGVFDINVTDNYIDMYSNSSNNRLNIGSGGSENFRIQGQSALGRAEISMSASGFFVNNYNTLHTSMLSIEPNAYMELTNTYLRFDNFDSNGYQIPTVDGTDGQVLTTDGAGTVTWQDLEEDSGWQATTNSADLTSSDVKTKTKGSKLLVYGTVLTVVEPAGNTVLTLPVGYRSDVPRKITLLDLTTGDILGATIEPEGTIECSNLVGSANYLIDVEITQNLNLD